ncbi:hypothetical protein BC940DRAFT_302365 [Gongronella butleri]|nr:hypothetical protein BC940DRAFT_302365 [Gongronella butleri]
MSSDTKQTPKPTVRKKKAARACIHCQKAHLTCDDARPCQRCTKRGLANTCTDGTRKKAKYLQDVDESQVTPPFSQTPQSQPQTYKTPPYADPMTTFNTMQSTPIMENNPLMSLDYGFGSSATNLEYSILSNMLGVSSQGASTPPALPMQESPFAPNAMWATTPPGAGASTPPAANAAASLTGGYLSPTVAAVAAAAAAAGSPAPLLQQPAPLAAAGAIPAIPVAPSSAAPSSSSTPSTVAAADDTTSSNNPNSIASSALGGSMQLSSSGMSTMSAFGDGAVVAKVASPITMSTGPSVKRRNQVITPTTIYTNVKHPFSYADGYHYLINYVRQNMGREELMRISRALALFRPSVLASMMNLTTDDLIFTEKCVQRTLLEYEKLITYSGTPTVVWRRTGEIVLVGKEFSLLTQWSKDSLLNKKTYIYELMSNSSAIEYWEQYAVHAFDNTDSAVYSSCILVSPAKRVVPCTFCFTIKRDIFDLPSVIVGNVSNPKRQNDAL